MWHFRYRLRVLLLSFGVLLGYGSAYAHYRHLGPYGYGHRDHHGCRPFESSEPERTEATKPVK